MNMTNFILNAICCTFAALSITHSNAIAQNTSNLSHYYIGIDNNTEVGYGEYTGFANPNYSRVTLLFNHVNLSAVESSHYHPIGNYSYIGGVGSPTVIPTNGNNRLPETYTGLSLELATAPVSSPYEGMLISGMGAGSADVDYGNMEIRKNTSIPNTDGYGPLGQAGTTTLGNAAYYMYNLDIQDFMLSLDGLDLEIQLTDITPGLAIGDSAGNLLMDQVDDTASLFSGLETFTPTFFTAADAAPGVYSASFQLNDSSNTYMSSGTFHFDFTVTQVPEPASLSLLGLGCLTMLRRQKRVL